MLLFCYPHQEYILLLMLIWCYNLEKHCLVSSFHSPLANLFLPKLSSSLIHWAEVFSLLPRGYFKISQHFLRSLVALSPPRLLLCLAIFFSSWKCLRTASQKKQILGIFKSFLGRISTDRQLSRARPTMNSGCGKHWAASLRFFWSFDLFCLKPDVDVVSSDFRANRGA